MELSELTLAQLQSLVAEETKRRKQDALREIEAIAAQHGLTLAEIVGNAAPSQKTGRQRSPLNIKEVRECARSPFAWIWVKDDSPYVCAYFRPSV